MLGLTPMEDSLFLCDGEKPAACVALVDTLGSNGRKLNFENGCTCANASTGLTLIQIKTHGLLHDRQTVWRETEPLRKALSEAVAAFLNGCCHALTKYPLMLRVVRQGNLIGHRFRCKRKQ